ncbi:hypothetical protein [Paraburkholderia youngii]|uniref:hypothetical protein n=1 Tax=Paraburkholderia youngii TaxID=2782701 RepID=UPI003D21083D
MFSTHKYGNYGAAANYAPNSHGEWAEQPDLREPSLALTGAAYHWDHRVDEDHYEQPGILFRRLDTEQRKALFENTAARCGVFPGISRSGTSRIVRRLILHMDSGLHKRSASSSRYLPRASCPVCGSHAGLPQFGAPSKNIIMLFMTQESREKFVNSMI